MHTRDQRSFTYLDYAAATPMDERVLAAMQPYFSSEFYNPSALYQPAVAAKVALEDARAQVGQIIGARPAEIVFTAGGTESANLAVIGIMQQYPDADIVISAVEHDAVYEPARQFNHRIAPVDAKGRIDVAALSSLISDTTVLVSCMLVNNEVGTLQPVKEIAGIIAEIRKERASRHIKRPLLLHTDACQASMYIDCNVAQLGVDLMTLNGGKIYGPKQSGILYVRAGVVLHPLIRGGGQEWGLRSGTENVAASVGFATALQLSARGRKQRATDMQQLRDWCMARLEQQCGAQITGHKTHRIANNVHAMFAGCDNERVLFALDACGIGAATGSACSASKDTPSRVLLAMGYSDSEARQSIRFSFGVSTTKSDIEYLLASLPQALAA